MNKNPKRDGWRAYIADKRKEAGLRKVQLARATGINASYFTLIERDGYVPSRSFVLRIAHALDADVQEALLWAGYSPVEDDQIPQVLNFLRGSHLSRQQTQAKVD